jgi:hypothetical protein
MAGDFTAKHLPWYKENIVPDDELNYYLSTKKTGMWMTTGVYKYFTISPQTDLGNKLRVLCSGILMAKKIRRIPVNTWEQWKEFFVETDKLRCDGLKVDYILSEWIPGDYWYQFQNSEQKKWKSVKIEKIGGDFGVLRSLRLEKYQNILLETSLGGAIQSDHAGGDDKKELSQIYQEYFIVRDKYQDILDCMEDIDIGVYIQRGNFLKYFPESEQSLKEIVNWILRIFEDKENKSLVILGNDSEFISEIQGKIKEIEVIKLDLNFGKEMEFIHFLILAIKCKRIYGTPKYSMVREAGLFRGKFHYGEILS